MSSSIRIPRMLGRSTVAGLALVGVLGAYTAGRFGAEPGDISGAASASAATPMVPPAGSAGGAAALQSSLVGALRAASPSVVEISSASGLGSGVIFDSTGDVVTNAHVVGDATTFTVLLASGKQVGAHLVGRFVPDDLAVIRLSSAAGTRPVTFANSASLRAGDLVLAIGSPYGLSGSVTDGIVSSTGRTVSESSSVVLADLIQTSAAINPGNSGGALVDLAGHVVGIPTLVATNQQSGAAAAGIGFAIPSNTVRLIAPQLIATGKVSNAGRAALGISASTAFDSSGQPAGVYVVAVQAGGPAAKAGIVAGDVIVTVASRQVTSLTDLQAVLAGLAPGARVPVTVVTPAGSRATLQAVLGDLAA